MRVSVCVATYQGERYIGEQLASVLPQLGPDDEVIVSDDASSDGALAVVESFHDARIRILAGSANVGYSKNFERALSAATGDVIFICDQDDVWLPDKVTAMTEALRHHDLVVADVTVVDGDLREISPSHFGLHGVRTGLLHNFVGTRYIGASMAMRRQTLELALPLPERSRWCAYDYWIAVLAELYLDVGLIERPLMLYRRHDTNASGGGMSSGNSLTHQLAVRAYTAAQLVLRFPRARGRGSPQGEDSPPRK